MANGNPISFTRSPCITSEKLNGQNYLSWAAFVEMWSLAKVIMITLNKMEAMCQLKKLNNENKLISNCASYCGNPWNQDL